MRRILCFSWIHQVESTFREIEIGSTESKAAARNDCFFLFYLQPLSEQTFLFTFQRRPDLYYYKKLSHPSGSIFIPQNLDVYFFEFFLVPPALLSHSYSRSKKRTVHHEQQPEPSSCPSFKPELHSIPSSPPRCIKPIPFVGIARTKHPFVR